MSKYILFKKLGAIGLGTLSPRSKPTSNKLKKDDFSSATSLEDPTEPFTPNSKISAPLKTFLLIIDEPTDTPISCILEWDKSKSNPSENFSFGIK